MQSNVALLAKKAINAALKADWQKAVELNTEILDKKPKDIDAKLRLGRAYIQLKKHKKAKRLFSQVLKLDPINQVAKRNLENIENKKVDSNNNSKFDPKSVIMEPGTTTEISFEISAKKYDESDFSPGEEVFIKTKKKSIDFYKQNKKKVMIGTLDAPDIVKKFNLACDKKSKLTARFVKGKGKIINLLIKCSTPIFRSEKQDVRPYLKKGSIEEPELEIESHAT